MLDEVANGVFQLQRAAVDAAPDLFFGQLGEPALDQIQPGSRSGSEVQVEARTLGQPAADQLGFVRAVVIQDEVYVQFCGHVAARWCRESGGTRGSDDDDAVGPARGRWPR